ncbi:MAG: stage II sporulation protein R [Clostridia bacterium]|nr:stage II sporulation protein R [Clostridia bacterium]
MKKFLFLPLAAILSLFLLISGISTAKEASARENIIRLHVRAADDSPEEQALKLKVRDGILKVTGELLSDCNDKQEAKNRIISNLDRLTEAGQEVVTQAESNHAVSVTLGRETFEYREYDGFFLPEGIYDSLIVSIGPGEGKNWWCVVFPAACYVGAAEVQTDESKMPECFQLAKSRTEKVTVRFWLWEKLQEIFN